jgi:hypothetical protein
MSYVLLTFALAFVLGVYFVGAYMLPLLSSAVQFLG